MKFNIENRRRAAGLTQAGLGKLIGVTPGAIANWEVGTRNPGIETLVKLADIFGCKVDDLIIRN